jgi:hypothetical protein
MGARCYRTPRTESIQIRLQGGEQEECLKNENSSEGMGIA